MGHRGTWWMPFSRMAPGQACPREATLLAHPGQKFWECVCSMCRALQLRKINIKVWSLAPKPRSCLSFAFPWPHCPWAVGLPHCYNSSLTALGIQLTSTRKTEWDSDMRNVPSLMFLVPCCVVTGLPTQGTTAYWLAWCYCALESLAMRPRVLVEILGAGRIFVSSCD